MDRETLGLRIRLARTRRGWTQEQLAETLCQLADDKLVGHPKLKNVSQNDVSRWEREELDDSGRAIKGVTAYYWLVAAVAKALDVSVRFLLGLTDRMGRFVDDLD